MALKNAVDESDSEGGESVESPQPSDKELERALRDAVAKIFKTGKTEELTVKRVRLAAEQALQIEEGFFKSTGDWKARSDQIIKDEVEIQDAAPQESVDKKEEEENAAPRSSDTEKATKRAKPKAAPPSRKRRKTSPESDAESDIETEKTNPTKAKSEPSEERVSDESDEDAKPEEKDEAGEGSDSEMSVVLDEEPQPKRQRQKKSTDKAPAKKEKKKAPAKVKETDADPNQTEIKRLQGWLTKCGIRKMWARELAPYDTPKVKIKHLKDMLKDAGMEGRYSLEKARQIKEERELREDLEMVQEGAKRWGKDTAEGGSDSGGPRQRLNRGRKALAFLESDGEETE